VEPYKRTLFTVNDTAPGCEYIWNIAGPSSDPSKVAFGVSEDGTFEVSNLEIVGDYVLTVEETNCSDDSKSRYGSKTVSVDISYFVSSLKCLRRCG
jgi:hypothetical protein